MRSRQRKTKAKRMHSIQPSASNEVTLAIGWFLIVAATRSLLIFPVN